MAFNAQPKGRLTNALRIGLATDAELLRWDEEAPGEPMTVEQWEEKRLAKRDAALRVLDRAESRLAL